LNSRQQIVLATRNPGKVKEIGEILARLPVELLGLDRFPELEPAIEDGSTFDENATKKAVHAWQQTGLVSLADDSGLEVDALGGKPGVLSARFAGEKASYEENNRKLVGLVSSMPFKERTARFVCVAALVTSAGDVVLRRGYVEGLITDRPAGCGGFGYDPIFFIPRYGKTVAQLDDATKNRISHRAEAFRAIGLVIQKMLKGRGAGLR
jgi:XTP/dITP diphosphohydrolase